MITRSRLERLEQEFRERARQAGTGNEAKEELWSRIQRHWKTAVVAAQEGRTHYLFAADKLAYLEARYPGPFADRWRVLSERLAEEALEVWLAKQTPGPGVTP